MKLVNRVLKLPASSGLVCNLQTTEAKLSSQRFLHVSNLQMEDAKLACTSEFLIATCACFQTSRDGYGGAQESPSNATMATPTVRTCSQ